MPAGVDAGICRALVNVSLAPGASDGTARWPSTASPASTVVSTDKKKQVAHLKTALKEASELLLATDPDREGEAIAYHVAERGENQEEERQRRQQRVERQGAGEKQDIVFVRAHEDAALLQARCSSRGASVRFDQHLWSG